MTDPRSSTLTAIQKAFEKAGVVFLEPGDTRRWRARAKTKAGKEVKRLGLAHPFVIRSPAQTAEANAGFLFGSPGAPMIAHSGYEAQYASTTLIHRSAA